MKKVLTILLLLLGSTLVSYQSQAQRVLAYYPYYVSGEEADVQYDKLTDIVYAFLQLTGTGSLGSGNYFITSQFAQIRDLAHLEGVNVHVSVGGGGAPSSDLAFVSSDGTKRATMVADIVAFVSGNHVLNNVPIKGIDVDWEFPISQTARDNHEALLSELRTALDAQGVIDDTHYELSIAIGADVISPTGHDDYINPSAFQYPDLVSVMAYDLSYVSKYGGHHSSYQAMIDATTRYNEMGCPYSKMNVGVPFYGRTSGGGPSDYNVINSSGSSTIMQNDFSSPYYYNGTDLIEQKADYMIGTLGGQGITIWELTQDRTDQFSLLAAAYDYIDSKYGCSAPQPDLGDDVSLCGSGSVTLNSALTTASGRTFSWERDGAAISGSGPTLNATIAGTYTVIVSESGCFKIDDIEVNGTLPSISLGGPYDLCNPSTVTLDASVSGNGINYSWKKDGLIISGESDQTLLADAAGNYEVTVNASGCSSETASATVTSSLINAMGDSRCFAGEVTLSVLDNNGPYEWYNVATDGSSLHQGNDFTTSISNSTTFYVHTSGIQQSVITGPTTFTANWSKPMASGDHQPFTIHENLTFNSITVQAQGWGGNASVNIKLYDGTGTSLIFESGNTVVLQGETLALPIDEELLPGDYRLAIEGSQLSIGSGNEAYPFTETDVITINGFEASTAVNGSDSYFFNWDVTTLTGSPCERTPVEAIVEICTGHASSFNQEILVSPNPTINFIHVSGIAPSLNTEFQISSISGIDQSIVTLNQTINSATIDVSSLTPGIYILRIQSTDEVTSKRFVVND